PRWRSPTGCWCSAGAASPRTARPPGCWPAAARTRRCTPTGGTAWPDGAGRLVIVAHAGTVPAWSWEIYPDMTTGEAPDRWPRSSGRPARDTLIVLALAGYAWVASAAAPFSGRALVSVLVPGAALGVIACGWPPERIPAPGRLDVTGFSYWAICIAATLEWEASAFRSGSHPWH